MLFEGLPPAREEIPGAEEDPQNTLEKCSTDAQMAPDALVGQSEPSSSEAAVGPPSKAPAAVRNVKYVAPHLRSQGINDSNDHPQVRRRVRGSRSKLVPKLSVLSEVLAACSGGPYGNEHPLNDITGYSNDGQDIYVRMPAPELERLKFSSEGAPLNKIDSEDLDLPLSKFKIVAKATNNFSDGNKLGEGGFGPVYKIADKSRRERRKEARLEKNKKKFSSWVDHQQLRKVKKINKEKLKGAKVLGDDGRISEEVEIVQKGCENDVDCGLEEPFEEDFVDEMEAPEIVDVNVLKNVNRKKGSVKKI
ncbi:hypothetical protein POM88_035359 [Heracleum sosnowskyi]|uniref:Uncharacterized protein n=1 Tax=Heracleum sosnowskyi TaxID=360622 RepID=A0AAD8HN70_9APIA|nr:hypothetical protein POM88_035359 [Heracleum sosnowskyi]